MIHQLVEGQEVVIRTARTDYPLGERIHDQVTADLLIERMPVQRKDRLDAAKSAQLEQKRRNSVTTSGQKWDMSKEKKPGSIPFSTGVRLVK